MCETCPKRASSGVFFDPEIVALIKDNIVQGNDDANDELRFPEVDPLELDHALTHRVGDLADYGNPDAEMISYLVFNRKRTSFQTYPFPVTTTLEMIGACSGPEKIKRGLFRSSMQCSAYREGMGIVAEIMRDNPEALKAYTAFVERQDKNERYSN